MGNSLKVINDKVRLMANDSLWIETKATDQLCKTATLANISIAVGMPDLHPGRGYPIGAAFLSKNHIYPALVGNDIGCGMSFWQTSIKNSKKLEQKLLSGENLDTGNLQDWQADIDQYRKLNGGEKCEFDSSLGTIGGGNHFAEFQKTEKIYDEKLSAQLGINSKSTYFLVHSGSRGLGQSILRNHVDQFSHNGLKIGSKGFNDYMAKHHHALQYAKLNRWLIAQRFLNKLNSNGSCLFDVNHNMVEQHPNQQNEFIHRKGATPSDQGLVMIPGSRGDYSYLVQPTPNETFLNSLAHGAGRKWQRSQCKDRLKDKYSVKPLKQTSLNSKVICSNKELLFEEAPQAYKSIDSVIEVMVELKLIKLVAKFKPIITYKTNVVNRGCC